VASHLALVAEMTRLRIAVQVAGQLLGARPLRRGSLRRRLPSGGPRLAGWALSRRTVAALRGRAPLAVGPVASAARTPAISPIRDTAWLAVRVLGGTASAWAIPASTAIASEALPECGPGRAARRRAGEPRQGAVAAAFPQLLARLGR
jgi:hypothetical protein